MGVGADFATRSLTLAAPSELQRAGPRASTEPTIASFVRKVLNEAFVGAARLILVNAVERHPDVALFHYNLAYYECRLGNLDEARARRSFVLRRGKRFQKSSE